MYKMLNKYEVVQLYVNTLTESEDPDKRRDALVVLTFYAKTLNYNAFDCDNDNDDDDNDNDDNDDDVNDDNDNDLDLELLSILIRTALQDDPDAEVRMYAAWAIGFLNFDNTDFKILIPHLNDEDIRVRLQVVQSLGNLQKVDTIPAVNGLFQALADKDVTVRMYALKLLLNSHSGAVLRQIRKLLDSVDADNNPTLIG